MTPLDIRFVNPTQHSFVLCHHPIDVLAIAHRYGLPMPRGVWKCLWGGLNYRAGEVGADGRGGNGPVQIRRQLCSKHLSKSLHRKFVRTQVPKVTWPLFEANNTKSLHLSKHLSTRCIHKLKGLEDDRHNKAAHGENIVMPICLKSFIP